eukprot:4083668-Ditylum_brightwellii.AAC.1
MRLPRPFQTPGLTSGKEHRRLGFKSKGSGGKTIGNGKLALSRDQTKFGAGGGQRKEGPDVKMSQLWQL